MIVWFRLVSWCHKRNIENKQFYITPSINALFAHPVWDFYNIPCHGVLILMIP